jgi:hypothetical protein
MRTTKLILFVTAGLALSAFSAASASPLLYVDILGSTTGAAGSYANSVTATPSSTIYFELNAVSASPGATNTHTTSTPDGQTDSVDALPFFNITDTSASGTGSFNSASVASTFQGSGQEAAITNNGTLLTVRALDATAGGYVSTDGTGATLVTGTLVVGSTGTDVFTYAYNKSLGGFKVAGTILNANSSTETSADPYLSYDGLTIIATTPEPASLGLLAMGGLALMRRRRTGNIAGAIA